MHCHAMFCLLLFCITTCTMYFSSIIQIEESGGTAITFSADVSIEAEVESMMRAVSMHFRYLFYGRASFRTEEFYENRTNPCENATNSYFSKYPWHLVIQLTTWVDYWVLFFLWVCLLQAIDTWGTLDVLVNNAGCVSNASSGLHFYNIFWWILDGIMTS